ncbi:DUF2569 family protein [Holophaga foetida]|uniref:DUF2569 family protein n=1 Tax=Holophaga foetida TaxID=35839 RepID=UPI00024752F1
MTNEGIPGHPRPAATTTQDKVKLIELRDDRNPIPPSIGGSSFEGILFGPLANQPSPRDLDTKNRTLGIGGWLILPIFFIIIGIISNVAILVRNLQPMIIVNYFNMISCSIFAFYAILTLGFIFKKHYHSRLIAISYFSALSLFKIIDYIIILAHPDSDTILTPQFTYQFAVGTIFSLLCAFYFILSIRVKATFRRPTT